jgi:WD40 repeat protein
MQIEPRNADPPKRKRRWFQFSLRTLLIVVTLLAVVYGYLAHESQIMHERKVMLDLNMPIDSLSEKRSDESIPPIRRWFGDKAYEAIALGNDGVSDALVQRYRDLFPEAQVCRASPARRPALLSSLALSSDGRLIAAGFTDGKTEVWDYPSGRKLNSLSGRSGPNKSVAFSPDCKELLTTSATGLPTLCDPNSGKQIRTLAGAEGCWSVAFSPDGKYIVSQDQAHAIGIWGSKTNQRAYTLPSAMPLVGPGDGLGGVVSPIVFDRTGRYVACVYYQTAVIWDTQSKTPIRTFDENGVIGMAFSPNGNEVIVSNVADAVVLRDVQTGRRLKTFGGAVTVRSLAVSPDGELLAAGSGDGASTVWQLRTGKQLFSTTGHGQVAAIAFSRDGKCLVTGCGSSITLYDSQTGKRVRTFDR